MSDSDLIAVNERYCRMRRMLHADQTPHVDPARAPRLGGRARYDYAA